MTDILCVMNGSEEQMRWRVQVICAMFEISPKDLSSMTGLSLGVVLKATGKGKHYCSTMQHRTIFESIKKRYPAALRMVLAAEREGKQNGEYKG